MGLLDWDHNAYYHRLLMRQLPSSLSGLNCGIQVLELDAGILGRESPVDATAGSVARRLPRRDLPFQRRPVGLGSAGQVKPTQIQNPDGINLTAYCIGGAGEDYVTVINKAHGADAADAAVTIAAPGPAVQDAQIITLAGGQPGDARGTRATLGGAAITGDTPWDGTWSTLPADPRAGISLTVKATTAVIVKIHSGG